MKCQRAKLLNAAVSIKDRGHIGDTLSCFLQLLEHHPVRSGSCHFLRLRFGLPLSPLDPLFGCVRPSAHGLRRAVRLAPNLVPNMEFKFFS
jgi:hypothetical protein